MDDLSQEIQDWRNAGESIIVMGDFNENLASDSMKQWIDGLHMREVLLDKVGASMAPSTYDQVYIPSTPLCALLI